MMEIYRDTKEIKLNPKDAWNHSVRIGTPDTKENPKSVYINIGLWVSSRKSSDKVKNIVEDYLEKIYNDSLKNIQELFIGEPIFLLTIPEAIGKPNSHNFIQIELFLHTRNNVEVGKVHFKDILPNLINLSKKFTGSKLLRGRGILEIVKRNS